MSLHRSVIEFGKEGYRQLLEKYGKVDEKILRKFFYDIIEQKLPSNVDHYESAIDWQVSYLVSETMRKLKEGKVFDKYYVFYYVEPGIHGIEEDLPDKHPPDLHYIDRFLSVAKRHRVYVPRTKAINYLRMAERAYLEKTGKKRSQLTQRDYENILELALRKIRYFENDRTLGR